MEITACAHRAEGGGLILAPCTVTAENQSGSDMEKFSSTLTDAVVEKQFLM